MTMNERKRPPGAKVVTITSGKGGVGKTTTTANLGVALAAMGKKVVIIDADIGLRNLDVVMGLENQIVYNIVDVVEGRCKLRQAMIKHKKFPELYLIPSAQTRDKTAVTPMDMVQLANKLRPEFDFLIVDSPAGIERGFRNAVAPADEVVIVTNPEMSAIRDADRIIGLLEALNRGPGRLIVNRVKPHMVKKGEMMSPQEVTDMLSISLVGIVPEDDSVIPASNNGVPVTLNPQSRAGQAFRNIARRLDGEDVPFMELDSSGNLLQRIAKRFGSS